MLCPPNPIWQFVCVLIWWLSVHLTLPHTKNNGSNCRITPTKHLKCLIQIYRMVNRLVCLLSSGHLGHLGHPGHSGHLGHPSHLGHLGHLGHPGYPSHHSHLGHPIWGLIAHFFLILQLTNKQTTLWLTGQISRQ